MERLIKKDKNGRERFTDISVEDLGNGTADIVKITGVVGSEKVMTSRTNVKTGYEKALKRAQTMWNNEKTKLTHVLPMLANKWEDRQKYISEPFYVQPKLDGVRLLVSNHGCFSRTGKPVEGVEHLARGLKDGEYLDGECYAPNKTFEEITSMFKMNPKELEFHVFDYFDLNRPNLTFEERKERITIETFSVNSKNNLQSYHDMFVSQGHEGVMIREASSTYEIGKRSNHLLKYKTFQTEEYPIVDVKEGTGREKGTAIWICKAGEQHFSVRPEGTLEVRRGYLEKKDNYIGKQLTVRFQNLTALGVPRFPVGVAIRDYE
jgi:DNA ligase-1